MIALFGLVCDDGNFGGYNGDLIKLYLYLSRLQWERGYHDEAFRSLDKALFHAKELERVLAEPVHRYTSPLVRFVTDPPAKTDPVRVAASLPEDWPFWCNPDYRKVEEEIKVDPRWDEWVRRTKE